MPPNIARTIKGMSGEEMSRRAKDSTGADDLDGLQASNWLAVDVPDRRPAKRTSVSTDQRASVSSNLRDRSSPPIVHVLVPAHNEEHGIAAALASVKAQSSPVGNIVVIADNCTDKTVEIAESFGAEVFTTKNNVDRKAGALNQYLTTLITEISSSDYVLVMDADTILDERFVEIGLREFAKIQPGRPIAGVGGIFLGSLDALASPLTARACQSIFANMDRRCSDLSDRGTLDSTQRWMEGHFGYVDNHPRSLLCIIS